MYTTISKIQVVQFRVSEAHAHFERSVYEKSAGDEIVMNFISAFDITHSWDNPAKLLEGFDAVILGGSGDLFFDGGKSADDPSRYKTDEVLHRTTPLITHVFEKNIPMLGVCFGHQLVARIKGVSVSNDPVQAKTGSFYLSKADDAKSTELFTGIKDQFVAQFGHKDSLTDLPPGAKVLAYGAQCNYSALWYGGHQYTVQFHPELSADDMKKRMASSPEYLPEGKSVDDIIQPSTEASLLLKNFFSITKIKKSN